MRYFNITMIRKFMRAEKQEMEEAQKWAEELDAELEAGNNLEPVAGEIVNSTVLTPTEDEPELEIGLSITGQHEVVPGLEVREPEELEMKRAEEFHLSDWNELMLKSKSKWNLFSWNPENEGPWVQHMEYHYRTQYRGHEIIIYTSCDKKLGGRSRPKGTDAIRVVVPKRFSKKILRTTGWQNRVMEAVKEAKRMVAR